MKPEWKDAPLWAMYLAQDADGEWYWFECEPFIRLDQWHRVMGQYAYAGSTAIEMQLEQRP